MSTPHPTPIYLTTEDTEKKRKHKENTEILFLFLLKPKTQNLKPNILPRINTDKH